MHMCTNTHTHTEGEYLHSPTPPGYTVVVFNELEAGCFPLTAAYEWLINQTALLSPTTLSPLTFSLYFTQSQLCIHRYINGWYPSNGLPWWPQHYSMILLRRWSNHEPIWKLWIVQLFKWVSQNSSNTVFTSWRINKHNAANWLSTRLSALFKRDGMITAASFKINWDQCKSLQIQTTTSWCAWMGCDRWQHCLALCQLVPVTEDDMQCQHCARRR